MQRRDNSKEEMTSKNPAGEKKIFLFSDPSQTKKIDLTRVG